MKRVVAFFDMFDEVPVNAKYLFSRKVETPLEESDEQKVAKIVSNNPEANASIPAIVYVHYYEVDGMDFEELMEAEFGKKTGLDKMREFMHKYKISMK